MPNQLTEVNCLDGNYVVDEHLIRQIIESYYRAKANLNFGCAIKMESAWFEPELEVYEVDWAKARVWTEQQTSMKLAGTWLVSLSKMQPRITELYRMQQETLAMREEFKNNIQKIQKKGMEAINDKVESWGTAIDVAKNVRDLSASTLMVGGTVLTGGSAAALFAATAGTSIKFTAKLQDVKGPITQKDVAAASVQAVGDLIFTVIPATKAGQILRGVKGKEKAMLVVLEAAFDSSVSLIEGKEASVALTNGVMTLGFGGLKSVEAIESLTKMANTNMSNAILTSSYRLMGSGRAAKQASKTFARSVTGFGIGKLKLATTPNWKRSDKLSKTTPLSNAIKTKQFSGRGWDHAAIMNSDLLNQAVVKI